MTNSYNIDTLMNTDYNIHSMLISASRLPMITIVVQKKKNQV